MLSDTAAHLYTFSCQIGSSKNSEASEHFNFKEMGQGRKSARSFLSEYPTMHRFHCNTTS